MPAGMAELHRDPHPFRDQPQEIGQPRVVTGLGRSELGQQHGPFIAQLMPARADPLDPGFRAVSFRAWVRPRGAFTDRQNPAGNLFRQ